MGINEKIVDNFFLYKHQFFIFLFCHQGKHPPDELKGGVYEMRMKFSHPVLDGKFILVNGHYEVCSTCGGHGKHFRSDLDESRLVESMEEDGDYEGLESYYNGSYDQRCGECKGVRVVIVPELPDWLENEIENYDRCVREIRQMEEAERRMGA